MCDGVGELTCITLACFCQARCLAGWAIPHIAMAADAAGYLNVTNSLVRHILW